MGENRKIYIVSFIVFFMLKLKKNKEARNFTLSQKNLKMISEIKKEYNFQSSSGAVDSILQFFGETYWDTPEGRKKLEEEEDAEDS